MTSRTLQLDLSAYSLNAIKKAAYRLADRASIYIAEVTPISATVQFLPLDDSECPTGIQQEFIRRLTDEDLRERIADQTAPLRNLLIAHAFSQTSLFDPQGDSADFREDPLEIRFSDQQLERQRDIPNSKEAASNEHAITGLE